MSDNGLTVEIVQGDVLDFAADVLALKYAQHYYGSDQAVSQRLVQAGKAAEQELKPAKGDYVLVDSSSVLPYDQVLFIGVPPLIEFDYKAIEQWSRQALTITAEKCPGSFHLALTLHGPGFGLDEIEALHAEMRGILQAAAPAVGPGRSIRVSIVEHTAARVERLQAALAAILQPAGVAPETPHGAPAPTDSDIAEIGEAFHRGLESPITVRRPLRFKFRRPDQQRDDSAEVVGTTDATNLLSTEEVENKPRAFVAMPFAPEMEDVFYYGIQNPVRALGYVCERVDQDAFTGDILEQVKMRIENAQIVIADLTGANPNVYLEVGYAWGKGRQTVLVANKKDDLKFDVRGQRCLRYQSIKELETTLTRELKALQAKPRRP